MPFYAAPDVAVVHRPVTLSLSMLSYDGHQECCVIDEAIRIALANDGY